MVVPMPATGALRTTPEELLIHLREAGASRVLVSRDAFREGTVSMTVTYPTMGTRGHAEGLIRDVFAAVGDELWFLGSPWRLVATVEAAGRRRHDGLAIYDATMAAKHGEGLNLWNLYFLYEDNHEAEAESGGSRRRDAWTPE